MHLVSQIQSPLPYRGWRCAAHISAFVCPNRAYDDLPLIQAYLGHCASKYTAYYTRVAGCQFEGLWR